MVAAADDDFKNDNHNVVKAVTTFREKKKIRFQLFFKLQYFFNNSFPISPSFPLSLLSFVLNSLCYYFLLVMSANQSLSFSRLTKLEKKFHFCRTVILLVGFIK